jgi:hypothetical protein
MNPGDEENVAASDDWLPEQTYVLPFTHIICYEHTRWDKFVGKLFVVVIFSLGPPSTCPHIKRRFT